MKLPENSFKYRPMLLQIIKKYAPATCKVYLFGSRACGMHSAGSDIDLALDADHKIDSSIMGKIRLDIEESTIPFFVDVVDIHAVSKLMKEEIKRDGILWTQ